MDQQQKNDNTERVRGLGRRYKRGDRKGELNDSPEIPDRGVTSDIPGLASGELQQDRKRMTTSTHSYQWRATRVWYDTWTAGGLCTSPGEFQGQGRRSAHRHTWRSTAHSNTHFHLWSQSFHKPPRPSHICLVGEMHQGGRKEETKKTKTKT